MFNPKTIVLAAAMLFATGGTQFVNASTTSVEQLQLKTIKVRGTVLDKDGQPVIGATVKLKGTTYGAVTDLDGHFNMKVPKGATLMISYIGYKKQRVKVVTDKIEVTLVEDGLLDEVVVVGYGTQKKKLITGATVQLKGDKLQKLSTTTALGAMQGQSPGVNIVQNSGQPGEGFKVNIRGLGTIGYSEPLYVIDGVPGGSIDALNPGDIQSIDVLKDAASSAIYGARGANGVILITTKQGKEGKITVTYDGYVGVQNVIKMPHLLDAKEYMEVMDRVLESKNNGKVYDWQSYMDDDLYASYMDGSNPGTNWLEAIRNSDAPIQNHALNISGGSQMSKFSMGVSYSSQEGVFGKPCPSKYDRTTVRMNSKHVIYKHKDRDVITFGENLFYKTSTKSGIRIGDAFSNDILNAMSVGLPIVPIYNDEGEYFLSGDLKSSGMNGYTSSVVNPIASMEHKSGHKKDRAHNLNASAYLTIKPIKGLTFKSLFGYRLSVSSYRRYVPAFKLNENTEKIQDDVTQSSNIGWKYSIENTLNYKFKVKKNNFDVLLGQSYKDTGYGAKLSATGSDLVFKGEDYAWLNNAQSTMYEVGGSPWQDDALASFFGRVNYNYAQTYMASLVLRADGSSNFAKGNRWGYFPSASAGWVVTNESFMENTEDWLDFLKLRASWGQNGNCNISNFQYLSTIAVTDEAAYTFGNDVTSHTVGAYPNILANEDVTWETSEQLDLGFDARFFDARLGVNFDYYLKTTKDWLVQAPILATAGTGAPYINGGDVENEGYELAITWNDQLNKDFSYDVYFNFASNKNEVVRLANSQGVINGPTNYFGGAGTDYVYRCEVGKPIGFFYGYKSAGVFQNEAEIEEWRNAGNGILQDNPVPGDLKFVDLNHDGKIEDDDKTMIGNPHPDVTLGFGFSLGYKGFDFSVKSYANLGHQCMRYTRRFSHQLDNYTTEVLNYWHGEGTSNHWPRLTTSQDINFVEVSDIYVEDADFLKISNVTLGYNFKKLWKEMPFRKLRIYASVQNLYTFTNYKGMDPEVGASKDKWASGIDMGFYPSPRTVLVGANVEF